MFLVGGLAGRVLADSWVSTFETELKAASSLVLVVFAWLTCATVNPACRPMAFLIAAGMTFGCLGDASPLLGKIWPDPTRTLCNMVLFGLGHLAYMRAWVLISRLENGRREAVVFRYSILGAWLILGVVLWYFAAYAGPRHAVMRVPALAYTLLLSATAGTAVGFAFFNRNFIPVAIGAILFLISDILLAVWIFHDVNFQSFDLVWLSYGLGQMLIVVGTSRVIHMAQHRKTQ